MGSYYDNAVDTFDDCEPDPKVLEQRIQEIKTSLEKQYGREFTWEEATEAVRSIERLAHVIFDIASEQCRRDKLLKENPKGFHFDLKGYWCDICQQSASGEGSWYDKYGLKCKCCQRAINEGVIPGSVATKRESWYSDTELGLYFNIRGALLNKYIRQGLLAVRIIAGEGKAVHLRVFLMKDNKDVLPPKKLVKTRTVKIIKDGEEYHTQEYWYEALDVKKVKQLAKYKIMGCLQEAFSKPVDAGRFLVKSSTINPIFSLKEDNSATNGTNVKRASPKV